MLRPAGRGGPLSLQVASLTLSAIPWPTELAAPAGPGPGPAGRQAFVASLSQAQAVKPGPSGHCHGATQRHSAWQPEAALARAAARPGLPPTRSSYRGCTGRLPAGKSGLPVPILTEKGPCMTHCFRQKKKSQRLHQSQHCDCLLCRQPARPRQSWRMLTNPPRMQRGGTVGAKRQPFPLVA